MTPTAIAQEGPGIPNRTITDIGEFTYRASFQLEDGTEVFLVRSKFLITFLHQHSNPVLRQHFFSASLGFYFGKTMLGRPIAQSVEFDNFAFYPKWLSSAGEYVDLVDRVALIELPNSVGDGQLAYNMMLIDTHALTQNMAMFGGTFEFTNLRITLDDGSIIEFGDQDLQIEVIQNSNDYVPENAELFSEGNLEVDHDYNIIYINTGISVPLIVYVDLVLGYFLIGTGIVFLGLIILHRKGKITLPTDRLKGVFARTPPGVAE
jgi:hypothetical protein